MDAASDHTPPDPRLAVGDLQRTPPTPAQVRDQMREPETEAHRKDPLTQEPENIADQKHDANDNKKLKGKSVDGAVIDNENRSLREESSTSGKEQLMVKLKYKSKTTTTPPSNRRNATDVPSTGSNIGASPIGVSSPTSGSTIIKQETEDHRDPSSQKSKSIDPQIKIEKNGEDHALALKPLNEPKEGLGQVNFVKDEPEHDARQQVDHPIQGQVRDEMNVDVHLGGDAMHAPVNDNISNKPSDAVAVQAAAPGTEKVQATVPVEERRVNDVDGDYQQSGNVLPETARGSSAIFDEDVDMSDGFDLNEWASSAMNRPEADVGEASGFQQGQDVQAIDYQLRSSGFTNNGMNVQQEDQVEHHAQAFNTGQSDPGIQDFWNQRHPDFSDPVYFTNKSSSPHYGKPPVSTPAVTSEVFPQYQAPPFRHVSQQSSIKCSQFGFNPGFHRQQQLQAQIKEKKEQLEQARKLHEERQRQGSHTPYDFGYSQGQLNAPPPFLTGPLSYQRAPQTGYQQLSYGQDSPSFQQPSLTTMPYSQMPQNMSHGFNPASMYKKTTRAPMLPISNDWMPGPYVSQRLPKARKRVSDEHDCGDEGDASDDDEPLRTRVKRHPSVTSSRDSVIGMSPPPMTSNRVARHPQQDNDSDVEFVASKAKPKHTAPKVVQDPVRMPHPGPQSGSSSPTLTNNASPSSENAGEIDWTLPQYEIQRQPLIKGEEIPSAKVSLPGLVREELLLSPDHADEEVHLLLNIFIPSQRALSTPDPEPAIALLNFHTIAVMVIEAYVQYEIGDEFGTGRGHFHTDHDRGDAEYEPMREAVDADSNEIFFAVVDRYRAGLESKKKPLQLIRGTQEFCDVALDVIYYIKEHGLLRPEVKARAVRVDKGVKRGPRGGTAVEEKGKGKGTKRGTAAKPNEVQPRKKVKTAAAVEVKEKRSKPKTPGVTVVRR